MFLNRSRISQKLPEAIWAEFFFFNQPLAYVAVRFCHKSSLGTSEVLPLKNWRSRRQIAANSSIQVAHKSWKAILDGTRVSGATYAGLLRWCANAETLWNGKLVHQHIIKRGLEQNLFLANLLLQMYGSCGAVGDACDLFAKLHGRDKLSWNFAITAHARQGQGIEALQVFFQMHQEGEIPNNFVFSSIVSACANDEALAEGKRVHAQILSSGFESDVVVGNALIYMHGKCSSLDVARLTFDNMSEKNTCTWTAMISAYVRKEVSKDALELFEQMLHEGEMPNKITFVSIISACACCASLGEGKRMHTRVRICGLESDMVVQNALVNMYGKCGNLEDAEIVFHNIFIPNMFSWTAMIAVYAQHGQGEGALKLFYKMLREGISPDKITFVATLSACATIGTLGEGRWMHKCIVERGCESNEVGTALVSMYAKCGSVECAWRVFQTLRERNILSWNAMVAACAQHGHFQDVLQLFHLMQQKGESPDKVTFVCILSAFSHAGLVDEGCQYFTSIIQGFGLTLSIDHCNCVVDLLGRAGRLKEAEDFIRNMPCEPTSVSWMALLAACRNWVDVERGECAAKCVFELDPWNPAPYIVLANTYAAVGRYADSEEVINLMRERSHRAGSLTEASGMVHGYLLDDQWHLQQTADLQHLKCMI